MNRTQHLVSAAALGAAGCAVLSAAFLLPAPDIWTRLISAIALLGVLGLATLGRQRAATLRPRRNEIAVGTAAALVIYAAAWVLAQYGPVAAQARLFYAWRAGYSGALVAATVAVAAISEELFWRATVLRLLLGQLPMIAAVLAGTAMYALAHVASGTWLLPLAALGAGLVWSFLFAWTRNLTAPIVSHVLFDVLVLVIAPLA